MKIRPAITNASLLASNTVLPARAAASDEGRPAAPTIEAITTSVSTCAATSESAVSPASTCVLQPAFSSRSRNASACTTPGNAAKRGRNFSHCKASSSIREHADNANTRKRSGCRAITSSVLTPMEPVEPRIVTLRRLIGSRSHAAAVRTGPPEAVLMSMHRYDPEFRRAPATGCLSPSFPRRASSTIQTDPQ